MRSCGISWAWAPGGFGGPIASVGYMQRDLVERRRWLIETDEGRWYRRQNTVLHGLSGVIC